jgi:hypothetical protein
MVGASKILTVSYGTFSCTLEGFDDPFSTMKSIAEYFRDLAADDRYFGAEPPTPDAEMLSRIAEKEIQRRVEARVQDNGIVLKQLAAGEEARPAMQPAAMAAAAAPVMAAAAAPVAAAAPAAPVAYAPAAEPEFEPEYAADAFPAMADLAEVPLAEDAAQAETVAEKLSRIRAVVSAARAGAAEETFVDADLVSEEIADEDVAFDDDATELEIAEALAVFDGDEEEAEAEVEAVAEEAEVAAVGFADETEAEAVAEAENAAEAEIEDEDDELVTWASDEVEDEDEAAGSADGSVEMEAEAPVSFADEAEDEDDVDTMDDVAETEVAEAVAAETEVEPEVVAEDADDAPYGRVVKLTRPEAEGAHDAWSAADEDEEDEAVAGEPVAAKADDDWASFDDEDEDLDDEDDGREAAWAAPMATATEEAEDDLDGDAFEDERSRSDRGVAAELDDDPIAAEIRATLGAQLAASHQEEAAFEDEADEEEDEAFAEETKDSARKWDWDDEDEDEDEDEAFDADAATEAGAMAARERLGPLSEPEGDAADVDRLLEKTNTQMAETEGTRRRSAIAHLKAAVAATKADRLLKRVSWREKTDAEVQTQYRDDLAQVVRPRRPSEAAAEAPRERPKPIGEGKSPLMLVSELRVDGETSRVLTPIRPRRIQTDEEGEAAADMDGSSYEDAARFAEFAEKMGAKDLTDLLEAAAAYAAFVENRPHFSRPQLMKRVARYEAGGDFTREAGLRSFGQLLRQGKIRKLKRGQFAVADTTRFNPEARIAGE